MPFKQRVTLAAQSLGDATLGDVHQQIGKSASTPSIALRRG
jgi:hypothetical protein